MRILVMCSANRCRSPMGSALLRTRLSELGAPAEVSSAGFAPSGYPAEPGALVVMAELGIDLSAHRSRQASPGDFRAADLIVAMTRQHVVDAATIEPDAWPRTFPLIDLIARARQMDPLQVDEPIGAWVRRAHGGRTTSSVLALPTSTDIADPIGEPLDAYRRTREQLAELTGELGRCLAAGGGDSTLSGVISEPIQWDGWAE